MKKIILYSLHSDVINANKRLAYIYGLLACLSIILFFYFNYNKYYLYSHRWASFLALIYSMVIAFFFHSQSYWELFSRKAIRCIQNDLDLSGFQQAGSGNKRQIVIELTYAIIFTASIYAISSFVTKRFFNPIDFYFDPNNYMEGVFIQKSGGNSFDYIEIIVKNNDEDDGLCPRIVAIEGKAMSNKYKDLIGTMHCLDTNYPITPGFDTDIITAGSGVEYSIVRKHYYANN